MYLALYRKYRPKKFSEVVGQEHIVKTLLNQINSNHISHAYLFCGTRGTGKTSIAKIFAMSINCFDNKNGEACMECESCRNIINKQDPNIIEIDAASNNGVDNIRDIRDEVKYPPINGKYKIYIIDEVHMLSIGAFNALLKTLEEPPAHVIFILATTDPQKIPATIHSRCQRFDFKRIAPEQMLSAMKKYMELEGIKITDDAINHIIKMSDGAMRDALSILDQCISFYFGDEIDLQKVTEIIGTLDDKTCSQFLKLLWQKDTAKILDTINEIFLAGKDISQFLTTLIIFVHDVIIYKSTGKTDSLAERKNIFDDLNCISTSELINILESFSQLQNELKYAINPKISFELLCIKLCDDSPKMSARPEKASAPKPMPAPKKIEHKKKVVPEDLQKLIKDWPKLISKFDGLLKEMLSLSCVGYLKANTIYIITNDPGSKLILSQKKAEIKKILNLPFQFELDFMSRDEYDNEHKNIYGESDEDLMKQLAKINANIDVED